MYVLYHSPNCEHSQRLFRECNTNGVRLVDVSADSFPEYVTNVPTLEDTEKRQIYVGSHVFEVLKSNNYIEPFEFDIRNTMSHGFSYIGEGLTKYCEQQNYSQFE
jgi:hypothetical protein